MSQSESRVIAQRYVKALFGLATDKKAVDAVEADLQALGKALDESEALREFLTSPLISRSEAARAITAFLDKAKANAVTRQFFALLAQNRRLPLTPQIILLFEEAVLTARGEMIADVTTAAALSADQQKKIIASLTKATGKQVTLRVSENPAILGGFVVKLGSRMLDYSVAGGLERMGQKLKSA